MRDAVFCELIRCRYCLRAFEWMADLRDHVEVDHEG